MNDNTASGFPDFFSAAPTITVRDPLAAFLGAARDGVIEYTYADVVKLAGHSCPTVAGAYLMTRAALAALYPGQLPERGGVRVEMPQGAHEGVSGVMGNVIGMLTGAAGEGGFHGIGGRFDRRELIAYGAAVPQVRFTRLDTGASVTVETHAELVPGDPRLRELMPRCLSGRASADEAAQFGALWQERVRRLLTQHADDPGVFALRRQPAPAAAD
ncbi:FmdE family protein [Ramlibacter sp.]|uniref:FmdE family protein n=1 Tax=Ramlibacter sp. TaxID=1917967 RepID=UPI002C491761|nr:FmdE family protein [Ramlibacter sp.]HWI83096.1 FmdE family protein [Ramlibacter sp.]